MRAAVLVREKATLADGSIVEVVVWRVPADVRHPEGLKYRLAFIPAGCDRPAVLYDNHHPKGHHKHIGDIENPYIFQDAQKLRQDFEKDIEGWLKAQGTKR